MNLKECSVIFNHNTLHSSWGGGQRRKMFAINACQRYGEKDIQKFREYLTLHHSYQNTVGGKYFGEIMLKTSGDQRNKHLAQVLDNIEHLAVNEIRNKL